MRYFVKILFIILFLGGLGFMIFHLRSNAEEKNDYGNINKSKTTLSFTELEQQGDDFFMRQKIDSATVCFTLIAGYYYSRRKGDNEMFARAFNKLGHLSILQGDYTQAFSYFLKAIDTGNKSEGNKAKIYISVIYGYYENYREAMRYLKEAYDYAIEEQDFSDILTAHHNITNMAFANDQLPSIADLLYAFAAIKGIDDTPLYRYTLSSNKAMIDVLEGNYSLAIADFGQAIKCLENENRWLSYKTSAHENIAKCHALAGDYKQALTALLHANKLARQQGDTETVAMNTKLLAEYYRQTGDEANATQCRLKYIEMRDSMFTMQKFSGIHAMETSYQIGRIQDELAHTINEKHTQAIVLKIVTGVLVMIVLLLFFILRQNRTIRQANKDLYRKNEELMKHSGKSPHTRTKTQGSKTGDSLLTAIYEAVCHVMATSPEIYSPDFSIEQLSSLVGSNTKYVSKAINDISGKNFRTILNEYRISEAQRRLADYHNYGNYTNETIGEQVGFSSRTNFIAIFKKITGLTPKEYRKQARFQAEDRGQKVEEMS